MVDRGTCTFVSKVRRVSHDAIHVLLDHSLTHFSQVRNAQRAGAAGVLIADTTCLCDDKQCVNDNPNQACETSEPIMADDGSGSDVSIPSFLVYKRDADQIIDVLKDDQPVQVEMQWALPTPDDRVEYDLWTVPTNNVSKPFLKNFKKLAKALGDHAYFTPHQYVYDGVRSHCIGDDGKNFCYNLCTNNGRYCATDPDNDLEQGISGADVVKESLRRLCVWSLYGLDDGIGEKWWDYVNHFEEKCNNQDFFSNQDCINDAYKKSKIEGQRIEDCMINSGGTEADKTNSKLEMEIDAEVEQGVVVMPTVFVNNVALRGGLTASNVFNAICAGFSDGTAPPICDQCATCSEVMSCVDAGYCTGTKAGGAVPSKGVSTNTFASSMLFVIVAFAGVGAVLYKRQRDEMREQVRGILAEYMPLEDQDMGVNGGSPMDFARGGGTTSLIG